MKHPEEFVNNTYLAALLRAVICIGKSNIYIFIWTFGSIAVFFAFGQVEAVSNNAVNVLNCQQNPTPASTSLETVLVPEYAEDEPSWSGMIQYSVKSRWSYQKRFDLAEEEITLLENIAQAGCEIVSSHKSEELHFGNDGLYNSALPALSALIVSVALLAFGPFIPGSELQRKDNRLSRAVIAVLSGAILGIILGLWGNALTDAETIDAQHALLISSTTFFGALLFAVILFPLAEEIIFRRIALQIWIESKLPLPGIVMVSLSFALLHGHFFWYGESGALPFVMIFCLSAGASIAYLRGGLLASFLFHAGYNAILILPLYLWI